MPLDSLHREREQTINRQTKTRVGENRQEERQRGPHWVVQGLPCRRFNSAGPHLERRREKKRRGKRRREEKLRGKEGGSEEKRGDEKMRDETKEESKRTLRLTPFAGRECLSVNVTASLSFFFDLVVSSPFFVTPLTAHNFYFSL